MMDDIESAKAGAVERECLERIKEYRARTGASISEAQVLWEPLETLYRGFCRDSGFDAPAIAVEHIRQHQLSLYGPPCGQCGLPLRTPEARLCAACGAKRAA